MPMQTAQAVRRRRPPLSPWMPVPLVLAAALLLGTCAASFAQTLAPAEPEHVHVSQRGDTLIGLGRRLLIEPSAWREVARLNRLANPDLIPVGTRLRMPLRLLRTEALPVTVTSASGSVTDGAQAPVAAGAALAEGDTLATGADGSATVRLADGTLLRLQPGSRLRLDQARRLPAADASRGAVQLQGGRVDVQVVPASAGGRAGFEVRTPQGVLGVRGTEFRAQTDGAGGASRGEVLAGRVAVSGSAGSERAVDAGFGTVVDAAGRVAAPVPLLSAPVLSSLPVLQEEILVRFAVPAVPGAVAWRAQAVAAAAPEAVLREARGNGAELRLADLPDGEYLLRLRAIDAQGLEGRSAEHRFRLKARPEAPLPAEPASPSTHHGGRVTLRWATQPAAATYRLQLADATGAAGFAQPLQDLSGLAATEQTLENLPVGEYQWRLASVARVNGVDDPGPWGAVRRFSMRPPAPAARAPAITDDTLAFSWEGRPGQRFEFQIARDAAFAQRVVEQALTEPAFTLPRPGTGRFHVRLRAIEADGYVGPWGGAQVIDLPHCVRSGAGSCLRLGTGPDALQLAP